MDIKRAYGFRFYPTPEQEELLTRTLDAMRFVYNRMLRLCMDAWRNERKSIDYGRTSTLLTDLKKQPETSWLNEVSSVPIQQSLRHLQTAFTSFFAKHGGYPTFKCRNDKQAVEYMRSGFKWDGNTLKLAKMDEPLDIRWSCRIPKAARVTTVTVSKDRVGRYFVSLLCDDAVSPKLEVGAEVGIDLGLTHFAVLSNGDKITAPNTFRKHEARLAILQRRLARKQKSSARRAKAKSGVARLHAKITDARKDFLHKLLTRLINENQVIIVESLVVENMKKNRHLAKSISYAGWAEFIGQLMYKAHWYGRTLVEIDRWEPSSKRCNDCGYTVAELSLKVREWVCPGCGVAHDRESMPRVMF